MYVNGRDVKPGEVESLTEAERQIVKQKGALLERLDNDFVYHAPKGDQQKRYEAIRRHARVLAAYIVDVTPLGREQSLALTNLEQAIFWANAAIARGE